MGTVAIHGRGRRHAMSPGRRRRPTYMVPADSRAEVVLRRDGAEIASWPLVCEEGRVDLRAVNALARLQLRARRQGCTVSLRHACPHLVELLDLVGLDVSAAIADTIGVDVPDCVRALIAEGALGRKAGRGFFAY